MLEEETILDDVIMGMGHSEVTFSFARNMFEDLHLIMEDEFSEEWCEELKQVFAVICYWIASDLNEKIKMTPEIVNRVLGTKYTNNDFIAMKELIIRKLKYDILIYL